MPFPVAGMVSGGDGELTLGARPRWAGVGQRLGRSPFVRSVGATMATRAFTIAAGLVTSVILARALGPTGRGIFAVATALTAVGVQFGNLGLHASNTYAAARDASLVPALTANSLFVSAVLGALIAAIVAVTALVAPSAVPVHGAPLLIALVAIPVGLGSLLLQNLLLGVHDVGAFNRVEVLTRGAVLLLVAALVATRAVSVELALGASLLAALLGAAGALRWLRRHLVGAGAVSLALLRSNLRYGMRAYWAALFSFLVLRIDLLMVQYYLGAEQAGYYSVAVALADMLYMLPVVIGTLLFPRLTALESDAARLRLTIRMAGAVGALMVVLVGVGVLVARPAVVLLYGSAFLPVVPAFSWLAPGIALLGVHTVVMNYLASVGMPPITVYLPCAALLANVALNALLIPTLGIRGASLASVVAYAVMTAAGLAFVFVRRTAARAAHAA